MNNISQTTFSNVFSSMKMFEFRLKFHWRLFPSVQLTIFQHWFRKWLGAVQATSHYLNQCWLVYRRIYASRGLNELSPLRPIFHTYLNAIFPVMGITIIKIRRSHNLLIFTMGTLILVRRNRDIETTMYFTSDGYVVFIASLSSQFIVQFRAMVHIVHLVWISRSQM